MSIDTVAEFVECPVCKVYIVGECDCGRKDKPEEKTAEKPKKPRKKAVA